MAGSASDYLEKKLLDHSLGVTAYTMPANVFLALFTADPGEAGPGTEVSGNGYARQSAAFAAAAAVGGVMTAKNSGAKTFTAAGGAWGTITHWALFDALTSGNMLWHADMTASRTIGDGDQLVFAIDALTITAD
ncbi:hypothetical protein [Bosea sp. UC22_33]|uniref:phage tail fiber protein n=1 Tax=Bosea sp. UC22_33 TaxID=3350165 RepID=UPI00366BAE28